MSWVASELLSRKTEMDKVYRAYIDDEIDMKSFGSQYRPLEKRRNQVEEKIPELQAEIDFLKI